MRAAWAVFRKELLEAVRDRRTLLLGLLLPVIVMPAVALGLPYLALREEARLRNAPARGAVGGAFELRGFIPAAPARGGAAAGDRARGTGGQPGGVWGPRAPPRAVRRGVDRVPPGPAEGRSGRRRVQPGAGGGAALPPRHQRRAPAPDPGRAHQHPAGRPRRAGGGGRRAAVL